METPKKLFSHSPMGCPGDHTTFRGKIFRGWEYRAKSSDVVQVYQCPLCGKMGRYAYTAREIDIDDPRFRKAALPTDDWLLRNGVMVHERRVYSVG